MEDHGIPNVDLFFNVMFLMFKTMLLSIREGKTMLLSNNQAWCHKGCGTLEILKVSFPFFFLISE
jgi:hypothetical protein